MQLRIERSIERSIAWFRKLQSWDNPDYARVGYNGFKLYWIKSIILDKNASYQFIVLFLCNIAVANVQNKIYPIFDSDPLARNDGFLTNEPGIWLAETTLKLKAQRMTKKQIQ